MQDLLPAIEVYPLHHLPIIKAYADQLGLVSLINHSVPTEMAVDAGTVVLGLPPGLLCLSLLFRVLYVWTVNALNARLTTAA